MADQVTNEMIERCARAIAGLMGPAFDELPRHTVELREWRRSGKAPYTLDHTQDDLREIARAVLKELMTPTDEMVEAGLDAPLTSLGNGQYTHPHPKDVWAAMLTKALEEGE